MSTSENPETPPLTRRQLREIRNTGATPVIGPRADAPQVDVTADSAPDTEPATSEDAARPANDAPTRDAAPDAPVVAPEQAPEPAAKKPGVLGGFFARGKADKGEDVAPAGDRAPVEEPATSASPSIAEPAPAPPIVPAVFPPADAAPLGVTGLTRRQARAQERIRTASVPIIAPDLQPAAPLPRVDADDDHGAVAGPVADDEATSESMDDLPSDAAPRDAGRADQPIFRPAAPEESAVGDSPSAREPATSTVNPALGSDILDGQAPEITLPPSFDQLIARGAAATGSVSTPNALILSQTPAGVPLVGPVTSTGEVLITGTFALPEGLGSAGHAPGTTDGRDVDAVLLDGELPAASSPTPIAASAAISTVKQPGDIIRPPAPEKGSKLVVGLIITTGALAVLVAAALVLAFTTGVFG